MTSHTRRILGIVAVTGLAATAAALAPSAADAASSGPSKAAALTCHASMSTSRPKQYSTVDVLVRTAPGAAVRTVAHYKTTDTAHRRKANNAGRASIAYDIYSATARFTVKVDVTVTKGGRSKTCSTSFTPHS
jgi:hypothetical protein